MFWFRTVSWLIRTENKGLGRFQTIGESYELIIWRFCDDFWGISIAGRVSISEQSSWKSFDFRIMFNFWKSSDCWKSFDFLKSFDFRTKFDFWTRFDVWQKTILQLIIRIEWTKLKVFQFHQNWFDWNTKCL